MRALRGVVVPGMLAALALICASPAAAIEVGDDCAANVAEGPYSMVAESTATAGPHPLATPVSGVVTSWKVNSTLPERLAVFRPTGSAGTFQVVGESNEGSVGPGSNVFPTRIPVQAGDRMGLAAVIIDSPAYCFTGNSDDHAWFFIGSTGTGSTHLFSAGNGVRVPVVAVIEPDKDGDGYGDETQDGCPQSAAYQGPCPTIALDAFPIVLKRSVLVLVSASSESSVQVFGQISRGRITAPRSAQSSKRRPPKPVTQPKPSLLLVGGTQTVVPGQVARFNVRLPHAVIQRLKGLRPNKSLKATITAFTTDLAGRLSTRAITVRLKGQDSSGP